MQQYNIRSAWFNVDFGGSKYGIFTAAMPVEPLHSLENGLISDSLKILFYEIMTNKQKSSINKLARKLSYMDRQKYLSSGADKDMPRLIFKDGITSMTDITAATKVGIMLTVVVISLTNDGTELFLKIMNNDRRKYNNMQYIFEMLLCYRMLLKEDTWWDKSNDKISRMQFQQSIRVMLQCVKKCWPRSKGQAWELTKFHEQLHVPRDISWWGSPEGTSTCIPERNHIFL